MAVNQIANHMCLHLGDSILLLPGKIMLGMTTHDKGGVVLFYEDALP